MIRAVVAEPIQLPEAIARAVARPEPGRPWRQHAAGYDWHGIEWGDPTRPPVLLVHGVTSDSGTFWRVGPALAASDRFVVALDLPGHGRTLGWRGRHRFVETAADIVALAQARSLAPSELAVVGHSLGARTVASLPAAGLMPRRLVLLDPPALTMDELEAMSQDPEEAPVTDPAEGLRRIRALHPDWTEGDVQAKADGLRRFQPEAVRALLLDNGAWDACLEQLEHPAVARGDVWLIRGDPATGGLTPDALIPAFEARLGPDRIVTIPSGPHSPQRTHIEATVAALLRALG
jgi:pimeloyl-ACP methyl ester carboxylesterase